LVLHSLDAGLAPGGLIIALPVDARASGRACSMPTINGGGAKCEIEAG
jgi:hypothetical protein